jgi:hypothetical protein
MRPVAPSLVLGAVLFALLAAACGSSSKPTSTAANSMTAKTATTNAAAHADPKQMALRLGDLPPGYQVEPVGHYDSTATLAKEDNVPVAYYGDFGYDVGYEIGFTNSRGIEAVKSIVGVYRTAAGAERAYKRSVLACHKLPLHEQIGDEAVLCTTGDADPAYGVIWRDGSVEAILTVAGFADRTAPSEAVEFAKRQDSHLDGR